MKYVKKIPPTDKTLSDELLASGWKKLKEPSNLGITTLLSIPFMLMNAVIVITIMYNLYEPFQALMDNQNFSFEFMIDLRTLLYFIGIIIFMILHEFLHACFIPGVLTSDKTYWGLNGIYGFVYTNEPIVKGRFLLISIMPFFILSIILPFILKMLGILNGYTILLCLINAMGSCVDIFNICLVIKQIPNGANIINNGFETYHKINLHRSL
ncbi:DUF3267 domain-containing protein [Clostridium algoriphilum]|uniref:DUF3267 domain-containing protein n=1 Tax=Clostridium algoriphilum TaxID=198347 RepID=UPI001CF4985F|nr:DUF3267 domain-containing protein [Clostridium algoriphilum]MCB2293402.1 DUF3267 domain-containing protein [Clostridium algoriphilum]